MNHELFVLVLASTCVATLLTQGLVVFTAVYALRRTLKSALQADIKARQERAEAMIGLIRAGREQARQREQEEGLLNLSNKKTPKDN